MNMDGNIDKDLTEMTNKLSSKRENYDKHRGLYKQERPCDRIPNQNGMAV